MSSVILRNIEWHSKSPYENVAPEFSTIKVRQKTRLGMTATNPGYTCGKWYADVPGIRQGKVYGFSAGYTRKGEGCLVSALLAWFDREAVMIRRDYAYSRCEAGVSTLECSVDAPKNAVSVQIEFFMFCKGYGSCEIKDIALIYKGPYIQRPVTLATTYIDYSGDRTFEQNMEDAERAIILAAEARPDIVVLTESVYDRGLYHILPIQDRAITIPGEIYDRFAVLAKKFGTYLVICVHEQENGLFYNTAVLIDRNGDLVGKYRKTHLTISELEQGIVTGDDLPVFDTDFGKVGMLICWDHFFPEASRILYLKGAEVICIPTAGFIDYQSRSQALENGMFIVTAGMGGPDKSRIINREGEVIARVQCDYAAVTVDLNKLYYQYWLSVGPAWGEGRSIYINERRPDIYTELCRLK